MRTRARTRYRSRRAGLLPLEAVSLHVASVQALARQAARHRSWERALYTIHAAGYLTAMFLVLSPVKAVVFIIVQQALSGLYLGCPFAPTTSAMPVLAADDQSDFLRRHACGRGMDGKEDVELRAEAGNAQEPAGRSCSP